MTPKSNETLERIARRIPIPEPAYERILRRRDRKRRNQRIQAGVLGLAIAIAVGWLSVNAIRSDAPRPADPPTPTPVPSDLGIFAPAAGRIVYGDIRERSGGIVAVDPTQPNDRNDVIQVSTRSGEPLGWSSDGSMLLIRREVSDPNRDPVNDLDLFVLSADGTEKRLTNERDWITGSISPDGSQVVYALLSSEGRLYAVDTAGGERRVLLRGDDMVYDPAFSPDGTRIAYFDGSGDHSHSLRVANADGTDIRIVLEEALGGPGHVQNLTWSPDGSRLAYSSQEGGIWIVGVDGAGLTEVIPDGRNVYWSPDGSRISYQKNGSLTIADVDGTNVQEFGFAASGPWHPARGTEVNQPTPTHTRVLPPAPSALAYALDGDIYLADPDGSNAVKIADGRSVKECFGIGEYWAEGSMWSPDGRYLAYRYTDCSSSAEEWPEGVVISDAEGNVIAKFPTGRGWQIAWSPDSTRVAVWESLFETIGIYGLDGDRQTQLTMPPGWEPSGDNDPVWMPDGSSLMVENLELPLDGGTPRQLAWEPEAYSPDGSHVAYIDHRSLIVARSDGSEPREVIGDFVWGPTWSPTGERIAFVTHNGTHDFSELRVLDVATGSVTPLTESERGSWLGVTVIEFSPQGDRILFSRTEDREAGEDSLWSIGVDGSDLRRLVLGTTWGDWWSPSQTP